LLGESLFGVRRRRNTTEHGDGGLLSPADQCLTLAWEVLLPYLKRKLDRAFAAARQRQAYQQHSAYSLRRLLLWAFPWVHAVYEGSEIVAQWFFLTGVSRHFHVSQRPLGGVGLNQVFVRSSGPQPSPVDRAANTPPPPEPALRAGRAALVAVVVLYKALEWWHRTGRDQADDARAVGRVATSEGDRLVIIPPSPVQLPVGADTDAVPLPMDPAVCPLCLGPRVNPAATPGGVTFCYLCLVQALAEAERCPVTHLPCTPADVRRIYDGGV